MAHIKNEAAYEAALKRIDAKQKLYIVHGKLYMILGFTEVVVDEAYLERGELLGGVGEAVFEERSAEFRIALYPSVEVVVGGTEGDVGAISQSKLFTFHS